VLRIRLLQVRQIVVFLRLAVSEGYPSIEAAATGVRHSEADFAHILPSSNPSVTGKGHANIQLIRDELLPEGVTWNASSAPKGVHVRRAWSDFRTLQKGGCGGKCLVIMTPQQTGHAEQARCPGNLNENWLSGCQHPCGRKSAREGDGLAAPAGIYQGPQGMLSKGFHAARPSIESLRRHCPRHRLRAARPVPERRRRLTTPPESPLSG